MKKYVFTLLLMMSVVSSKAQSLQLGDQIVIDEIPCFILYLDDSGEHGLAITSPARFAHKKEAIIGKKAIKKAKETAAAAGFDLDSLMCADKMLISYIQTKRPAGAINYNPSIPEEVIPLLTDNGKENQEAIVEYCNEKGLSLQEKFPYQYWAAQLGEGWFIPGDRELQMVAQITHGGIGKKKNRMKEILAANKEVAEKAKSAKTAGDAPIVLSPFNFDMWGFISSTSKFAKDGFRQMILYKNGTMKSWFEFVDDHSADFMVCAIHEF